MTDLTRTRLGEYSDLIEPALDRYFPAEELPQGEIFSACRYSLLAGGKRLRPALLLEFYRQWGGNAEDALPFACALEMIHTYSLIHDDLPCMDDDDTRRGRPSNHVVYGAGMATLAGDALLNRAFELMAQSGKIPAPRALEAIAYVSARSGVYGMIGGQVQDLALEGKHAGEAALRQMVDLKTGALIRAACVGGAILAGAGEQDRARAEDYAATLGLAFQIRDDMLDVTGDPALLGKPVGSDRAEDKSTFAALLGLDECARRVDALTEQAVLAAQGLPQPDFLCALARDLAGRQS